MALTLHQSGHGHSHGGLGSKAHGHSHETPSSNEVCNGDADPEQNASTRGMFFSRPSLSRGMTSQSGALPGRRTQQANASVRAAFVHVVGDLLQSISVLISAIIIFFKVSLAVGAFQEKPNGLLG